MNPEMQAILDQLGISEEDLASMFEAGVFDERSGMLGDQMGMAQQLRGTPAPEMRSAGRMQVASSPLEMLAAGLGRVKGEKQMGDLMAQRSTLIDALRKGNQAGGMVAMRDRYGPPGVVPSELKPDPYGEDIPALLRRPDWQR